MGGCSISQSVVTYRENMTSGLIGSWSERQDSYSGDWNTCNRIGKRIKVADKYTEKVRAKFLKDQDRIESNTNKWESTVWDLGVVGYEVWTAKKVAPKVRATPVYETKYAVIMFDYVNSAERVLYSSKTLKEAHEKAVKYTLEGNDVRVCKMKILVKGNELVNEYRLERKSYKSKPKSVKPGSVLREMHKYYVTAIASC